MMEQQVYLIGIAVAICLIVLVYLFSIFLMREKPFEKHSIEEQFNNLSLSSTGSEQKQSTKKRKQVRSKQVEKQKSDDEKSKSSPAKKKVEIENEPKIISDVAEMTEKASGRNPSKPILVNKDEKSKIKSDLDVPETFHPRPAPVDELDQKLENEERRKSEIAMKEIKEIAEKNEKVETLEQKSVSVGKIEKEKKKKSKSTRQQEIANAVASGNGETTLIVEENTFQLTAELNGHEQEYMNGNDDVAFLKKQLDNKNRLLKKEQTQLKSSNSLVDQLRSDLSAEQKRSSDLEKKLQAINEKMVSESQEIKSRFQFSEVQHSSVLHSVQSELKMTQNKIVELSSVMKMMAEENGQLKDTIRRMSTHPPIDEDLMRLNESLKNAQIALGTTENAKRSLELKLKQTEDKASHSEIRQNELLEQKQQLEYLCSNLSTQLQQERMNSSQTENALDVQLQQVEKEKKDLQGIIDSLENNLRQFEINCHQMESNQLSKSEKSLANFSDETTKKQTESEQESINYDEIIQRLTNEKEDLLQSLQVQLKKNDELRKKNWSSMEALSEMEKRAGSVAHMKDELTRKDAEIERLKLSIAELESTVSQDEDKITNWQNEKKEGREEELEELRAVMQANEMCINNQENEIEKLTRSLELQKKKNDDLRKKNWCAMVALSDMEKRAYMSLQLEDDVTSKVQEIEQLRKEIEEVRRMHVVNSTEEVGRKELTVVTQVKESCHWDMSQLVCDYDTKAAEVEILQSLLEQNENAVKILKQEKASLAEKYKNIQETNEKLKEQLQTSSRVENGTAEHGAEGELEQLKLEIHSLRSQHQMMIDEKAVLDDRVAHYKQVLSETELILKKLESSVQLEESKWRQKLSNAETELAKVKCELQHLQTTAS